MTGHARRLVAVGLQADIARSLAKLVAAEMEVAILRLRVFQPGTILAPGVTV